MGALSDTASGTITGKEKVMLETFVQMTTFDRVTARANIRLMAMTGGRYELARREQAMSLRSQSGLDLDVVDHYNATRRDVRTLSGGESFQASLALALGFRTRSSPLPAVSGWIPCLWTRVSAPWTRTVYPRPSLYWTAFPKAAVWWESFPMWIPSRPASAARSWSPNCPPEEVRPGSSPMISDFCTAPYGWFPL